MLEIKIQNRTMTANVMYLLDNNTLLSEPSITDVTKLLTTSSYDLCLINTSHVKQFTPNSTQGVKTTTWNARDLSEIKRNGC